MITVDCRTGFVILMMMFVILLVIVILMLIQVDINEDWLCSCLQWTSIMASQVHIG